MTIFAPGPLDLKGIKSFDQLFAPISHSLKPTFLLSLSEKSKNFLIEMTPV